MKGVRHYLVLVPAVLFLVLAACKFDEPSLEIIAQEAYAEPDILIQARFIAEQDEHSCEYDLKYFSTETQVDGTAGISVLPAETWNDLPFYGISDGKYLFDFCVLDSQGSEIDCLHKQVPFWVDTETFVQSPTLSYTEDTKHLEIWTVFLSDHPDNANDDLSPVAIYYSLDDGTGPAPDINATKYNPLVGIVINVSVPPRIRTVAIDSAGHQSAVADYFWTEYQP